MTVTVSQGEGLTVISVTSNPKSKWPVLCQILGFLCYSPVCSVSQGMKGKLKDVHTAFGVVHMIIGVLNIVVGIVFISLGFYLNVYTMANVPFWIGSVSIVIGIVCILMAKFPSSCLLRNGIILNIVSAAFFTITAVVLYTVDMANMHTRYSCENYNVYAYGPEGNRRRELCLDYRNVTKMVLRGLDIMMIVLSVLQICVSISFCVLTGKALCKKEEDEKSVEDPELDKPLLETRAAGAGMKGKLKDVHTAFGIIFRGLEIMMIILVVLLLCVTIGFVF
ncbi:membrane-spanning 4-domains subfamily A member 4A-like [Puntigrus tetrazona]|uniref:membrane-spanning 4-domains subfamily A member 4A-like n=1 Tax=Puntigrus tetrazona TaxID=1606681 RepID=UPI001C897D7E|nr:membrane-spanning 4-domains subfamily A member 4A-like [Puntigrus tetrazona]